jgi:hypothetical protein
MARILPISVVPSGRVAACLAVAAVSLVLARTVDACERQPDVHIEVTSKFDVTGVRDDYSLAEIASLAHQAHRDANHALLGFYASEFAYTIDLAPDGDQACPGHIDSVITFRLQHRLIEMGRETTANTCVYPTALRHYKRLAEVDEHVVERASARAAAMLTQASQTLKQIHLSGTETLDTGLREQIRAVVDGAIAPMHGERQDAQQAVNNPRELQRLAHACSI